jgi:hypothetical protein
MLTSCYVTGTSLASFFPLVPSRNCFPYRGGKGNNRFYSAKTFCPFFCCFFPSSKNYGRPSFQKPGQNTSRYPRLLLPPILSMNTVLICGCKSNRLFQSPKTFTAFFFVFFIQSPGPLNPPLKTSCKSLYCLLQPSPSMNFAVKAAANVWGVFVLQNKTLLKFYTIYIKILYFLKNRMKQ